MDTAKREALRKGESKARGESCWVWTSVSPWGSLRKVAGDKAPKDESTDRGKVLQDTPL